MNRCTFTDYLFAVINDKTIKGFSGEVDGAYLEVCKDEYGVITIKEASK